MTLTSETRRTCLFALTAVLLLLSATLAQARDALPRRSLLGAGLTERDGVRITFLRPGGPAERAGLHVDDQLIQIGDKSIGSVSEGLATVKVARRKPIIFRIRRDGITRSIPVTLAVALDEQDRAVNTLYQSIEVDGSLRRTLVTVPKGPPKRRPAVLVISGIGCFSIDDASNTQDSYMQLAHALGRSGIVAMRVEKSGVGDSQGPPCQTVDLWAEIHAYEAALAALLRDTHVEASQVFLFGHSIGTLIAPRLANQTRVAGVIAAEGVGRNWIEYELANLRRQFELEGLPPAEADSRMAEKEVCMHRLLIEQESEAEIERERPKCREHNGYPVSASYMQEAASLNVAEPWTTLAVPLLVIYGTADFVTTETDHSRIVGIVNALHPGMASLTLLKGMDHELGTSGTPEHAFEVHVRQHGTTSYDADLSTAVVRWLCQEAKCLS